MRVREATWLRKLLVGLFGKPLKSTVMHYDNQSCIKLFVNPIFHNRSKHIEIPYHYIRYMVDKGVLKLEYISTNGQTIDVLTKPPSKPKLEYFKGKFGMVQI